MDRRVFLVPLLLGLLLPVAFCFAGTATVKKGVTFRTSAQDSPIYFDYDLSVSKLYFNNSLLCFEDVDMGYGEFEDVGFACRNATGSLTINDITPNRITYTVHLDSGISVTNVYVGDKGEPDAIKNDFSSEYEDGLLTIESTHSSFIKYKTVEIIYKTSQQSDPIDESLMLGDFIGAALQPYIDVLGEPIFYGFIVIVGFIPLMIRPQSFPFVVIFFILVGGIIDRIIPGPLISYGKGLMALGVFMVLIKLFWRKKHS